MIISNKIAAWHMAARIIEFNHDVESADLFVPVNKIQYTVSRFLICMDTNSSPSQNQIYIVDDFLTA
jgi:hypothetical protein